jgi:NAD(P)-dependent dehydrogenase (short-subunit alcohol dehydrogenase family)
VGGWNAADLPRQDGRRVIVTGANSGIGFVAARELARAGAHVVLGCRDRSRGEAAIDRLLADAPGARAELAALDLADLASVRAFAGGRSEPLDLLINNAGVMALPRQTTADGFERQLGTNHLGHFALTGLLLPRLVEGDDPRVVTISSNAHKYGRIDFDDLMSERGYRRWIAYGQSKLANLLFAFELQRRADAAGIGLRSVAAHPGYSATHLQTQSSRERGNPVVAFLEAAVGRAVNLVVAQSDEQGAMPTLYAATEDLPGAAYAGPSGPGEWRGAPQLVRPAGRALEEDDAARLWAVSEQLTGVAWPALAAAPAGV